MYRYEKDLTPHLCGGVLAALLCTPSLAADAGGFLPAGERRAGGLHRRRPGAERRPLLPARRDHLPGSGFAQEDIVWNGETQSVTASKDGTTISLTVGDSAVTWTGPSWSQTSEDGTSGSAGGPGGIAYLDAGPLH